jgi:hypothetical protein
MLYERNTFEILRWIESIVYIIILNNDKNSVFTH